MARSALALTLWVILSPTVYSQPTPRIKSNSTWPMYGGTPGRNMVNLVDRDILSVLDPEKGLALLWKADIGSRCYAQPVVAGGRIFVGTNNGQPRNRRDGFIYPDGDFKPKDKGILMCFNARTGAFFWQAVHDKLSAGLLSDGPRDDIRSIPAVDGDRIYYVSNRATVVCADVNGFANGNQGFQGEKYVHATDADIIWELDMMKELKVFPHNLATGCPLIIGDRLFVQTSNGVDEGHITIPSPEAPSFLCLDKHTGKVLWKDNSPGKNIMHGQWASPAYADKPVPQVIFPGGDGWLRAFEPETGKLLWKFDGNPKGTKYELGGTGTKSDFIAAPVIADGRLYIGMGQDPEYFSGIGHLWCIDLTKAVTFGASNPDRDVTPVGNNFDPAAPVNKSSALAWHYGGEEKRPWAPRDFKFGRTLSTVAVVDGIVYAPELQGFVHCLNAKTGHHYWQHDTKSAIWSAPYYVDGNVLVTTESGDLFVYRHDREPKTIDPLGFKALNKTESVAGRRERQRDVEKAYLKFRFEFDSAIRGTPSVANGVLYLATENKLYAFGGQ